MDGTLCRGLLLHTQANGPLVYPGSREDIVLKAAWHRGSNSSVVSDPFWEPGRTPLNAGLPSAWVSVDGDQVFPLFRWRAF